MNSGPVGKGRGRRGVDELAGGLRTAVNGLAQGPEQASRHPGPHPYPDGRTDHPRTPRAATSRGPGHQDGITAASMPRLTEVLEREGWVRRGPDPADRRACLLSLNDYGRTALEELRREGVTELVAGITTPHRRRAGRPSGRVADPHRPGQSASRQGTRSRRQRRRQADRHTGREAPTPAALDRQRRIRSVRAVQAPLLGVLVAFLFAWSAFLQQRAARRHPKEARAHVHEEGRRGSPGQARDSSAQ